MAAIRVKNAGVKKLLLHSVMGIPFVVMGVLPSWGLAGSQDLETESRRLAHLPTPEGMVRVPAGEFSMGSHDRENRGGYQSEQPEHRVYLDAFEIDRYEVGNVQYLRFVRATGHVPPPYWTGPSFSEAIAHHPVVGVSWGDGEAFCRWAGKRLPTEAEWEKTARGPKGLKFPWGNNPPTPALARLGQDLPFPNDPIEDRQVQRYPPVANVDAFGPAQSPYGVYQMAGNVMEWVQDWWSADYYRHSPDRNPHGADTGSRKIIRGGSWNDDPLALRTTSRASADPGARTRTIGFRCARDVHD